MKDLGVLVVDDDTAILVLIERMFSLFKIRVDCAMSGAEALERLKIRDYRTMITDLDMPDMNGLELAHKARKQFPHLNVILFTGNTTEEVMHLAINPTVSDISEVHQKPYGLNDMLKCIIDKEAAKIFLLE